MTTAERGSFAAVTRRGTDQAESARANKGWWDAEAVDYYAEHGGFLGDSDFVWGPEGLREADARLLGPPAGRRVLEVGAGAGQCSRWVATQGGQVVATDLSMGMLAQGRAINATVEDLRELLDRGEEQAQVEQERRQHARGQHAGRDPRAQPPPS